jgi:hypothetical protein
MEEARRDLANAIQNHSAEDLREIDSARHAVKEKVDAILSKFNF